MSEYISKKLAEEILCVHCNECCSEEPCEPSDCDWLNEIRQSVGVDAVPVVRCKECTHYTAHIGWCDIHSCFIDSNGTPCSPAESSDWKMFDEDYFCKDGERKGGDE